MPHNTDTTVFSRHHHMIADPGSPSAKARFELLDAELRRPLPLPVLDEEEEDEQDDHSGERRAVGFVYVNGVPIAMRKADCARSSREGRPAEPSVAALNKCRQAIQENEDYLIHNLSLRRRVPAEYAARGQHTQYRFNSNNGRGLVALTSHPQAPILNHIASLKSRSISTRALPPTPRRVLPFVCLVLLTWTIFVPPLPRTLA